MRSKQRKQGVDMRSPRMIAARALAMAAGSARDGETGQAVDLIMLALRALAKVKA